MIFAQTAFAKQTLNADVIVIGAGGSGTAAAVAAAEAGAKSVIVLEKQPAPGGTGQFAEGMFAANSQMQLKRNIIFTTDEAFKIIVEYSHWRANAKLVRAFVDNTAGSVEWLKEKGVNFKELTSGYPNGIQTWHIFDGRGKTMLATLRSKFKSLNITLMTETPGKDLIVKDGRIAGVIAEDIDGEEIVINSKAVVVATGGFGNNKEMLKKYVRYPDLITVGNVGKVGDGINMMEKAGAALEGMDVVMSYRPGIKGERNESQLQGSARQPYLWVDKNGSRFCDESVIFQWPYAGNALERVGGTMYTIFDSNTKKYMMEQGIDVGVGVMIPVRTKLTELDTELKRGVKQGLAYSANTLQGLAKEMNIPYSNLKATVDEYNSFADDKRDAQFAKDSKYIQPVRKGPFYAIALHPTTLGTLGGARVTDKMQVVDEMDHVIPGLYAVGNIAAGLYGDSYDLRVSGSTISYAVTSGRLAGKDVGRYIKTVK